MDVGLVAGVIVIGFVHGVLPDHGWPIAAMYGLNRSRRWLHGTVAGLVLGIGHLFSSVVLVLAFLWFTTFAEFAEGPWMRYIAGSMLILLGIYEYRIGGHGHNHAHDNGHSHDHSHDNGHSHDNDHAHHDNDHAHHDHSHDNDHSHDTHANPAATAETDRNSLLSRIRARLPGGGGHQHLSEEHADRGLLALATTALLLGFAHEEPIQILAICAGTEFCLELMLIYSLAVIVAILIPTLILIAGYERHRETVEQYTPYLPALTGVVLVGMGLAFIVGVF